MRPVAGIAALSLFALAAAAPAAWAQSFPTKPVRFVTAFPVGSGPDAALRLVADKLTKAWGQQVIVDNRPGANGFIAVDALRKSPADGYTYLQLDSLQLNAFPHLYKQLPYDPARDFDPVTGLFRNYFLIVVPTVSPWKSVGDLVATAKAQNGQLTYGSWFIGSPGHLGASMLEAATGVKMTHVPYKELAQLYASVGNSEVAWAFGSAASAGPAVRTGKARYLAVAAPARLATYPQVPTVAEAGGPASFELSAWTSLSAPRGTPKAIIDKVSADVGKAATDPGLRERLAGFAYEPFPLTPGDMAKQMETESRRYAEVVKRASISLD